MKHEFHWSHLSPVWQRFWLARAPRERLVLRLLGWVVLAALLLQGLWTMLHYRHTLMQTVPRLSQQAEHMAVMRQAWQVLETEKASRPQARPELLRQEVESSLAPWGKQIDAQWTPDNALQVRGQVPFAEWLRWLARMHEEHGLVLRHAHVEAQGAGVRVDAQLAPATTP